jgi:hypothetical protein
MSVSIIKTPESVHKRGISKKRLESTGLCMNCRHKITLCGRPFSADIECNKCSYINHFDMSQQPVSCHPMDEGVHSQ